MCPLSGLEHSHRLSLEVLQGPLLVEPENKPKEWKRLEEPYQPCSTEPPFYQLWAKLFGDVGWEGGAQQPFPAFHSLKP